MRLFGVYDGRWPFLVKVHAVSLKRSCLLVYVQGEAIVQCASVSRDHSLGWCGACGFGSENSLYSVSRQKTQRNMLIEPLCSYIEKRCRYQTIPCKTIIALTRKLWLVCILLKPAACEIFLIMPANRVLPAGMLLYQSPLILKLMLGRRKSITSGIQVQF